MSEREKEVLKSLLNNTKEILEILDRINQSQERTIEKIDQIVKGGGK